MTSVRRAALVAALIWCGACGREAVEEIATEAAVPVTVAPARVETVESTVDVTGLVAPAPGAELTIVAPGSARIGEIPRAEGDAVRKGDVLVRFDMPSAAAEVTARRADVTQAAARVETARAAVARLTALVERGVAAQREVEEARRDQAEAEAALAQAQSAVTAATALADRAVVRASFAGVVAKRWHNPGDLVEASASDPILRVIDPNRLEVRAAVPIADLNRIVVGHAARIVGPGGAGAGSTRVLARPAEVERDRATADVRLPLPASAKLAAGVTVEVHIVAERHEKAVVIPASAVVHDGADTFVLVAGADGKAHRQAITIGLTAGNDVEVLSGVPAGALVIVQGQGALPDGASISVSK